MDHFVRSVRFAGVASVGGLTLAAGAALMWHYVQPEMLPLLSTWQLGAIMGTFVLPLLCFAIWQADRKVTAAAPVRRDSRAPHVPAVRVPELRPALLTLPPAMPTSAAREEADPIPAKGSGRFGHRPRQPRRIILALAHRHRRFVDV